MEKCRLLDKKHFLIRDSMLEIRIVEISMGKVGMLLKYNWATATECGEKVESAQYGASNEDQVPESFDIIKTLVLENGEIKSTLLSILPIDEKLYSRLYNIIKIQEAKIKDFKKEFSEKIWELSKELTF